MKRILSITLPSIIIFTITILSRSDKYILIGLFLLFPLIFILQGLLYSDLKRELIIRFILSSIAFMVPVNFFYNMGSCIELLIIYNVFGIISYCIKKKIISRNK